MGFNRMMWGPVQSLNRELKWIFGSFQPNGASAIVQSTVLGQGFTVARTGVGIYTITVADNYNSVLSKVLGVSFNALTATQIQWGTVDITGSAASTRTALINAYTTTTGAAVEIAANASNIVSFGLGLLNQSFQ